MTISKPKEARLMTYADLLDKLIQENADLIRENERLKLEIKKISPAATEEISAET